MHAEPRRATWVRTGGCPSSGRTSMVFKCSTGGVRRAALVVIVALLGATLPSVTFGAEHLEDRRYALDGTIDSAAQELDQSSAALLDAVRALETARRRLAQAEGRLLAARRAVSAARARYAAIQTELGQALAASADATAAVRDAQQEIDQQLASVRRVVVESAQGASPSLLELAAFLNSQRPGDIARQAGTNRAVLDVETAALQRVEAARAILLVQQRRLAAAEQAITEQEVAARESLRERAVLLDDTRRATDGVAKRTEQLQVKRAAAARARAKDLKRLVELRRERDRVADLLRKSAAVRDIRGGGGPGGSSGGLDWPVDGYISSPFGMRLHPVYGQWALHDGMDIAAPCGAPVRAASSGRVLATYYNSGYGNRIVMDNGTGRGAGIGTTYNHLSGFSTYTGERVQRGEIIGFVGTTGASTGCHLHFMVLKDGTAVNPGEWL